MSFYSAAAFYRPPIRTVTTEQLQRWLGEFAKLGVSQQDDVTLTLDFGERVDVRHKSDNRERIVSPPAWKRWFFRRTGKVFAYTSVDVEHEHDVEEWSISLDDALEILGPNSRGVARGSISGFNREAITKALSVPESEENERTFYAESWALSIEPTDLTMLGWDCPVDLGNTIHFSVQGPGYFWPWTFREWVDRCASRPEVVATTELCRSIWPVQSPAKPTVNMMKARREFEGLWPYNDLRCPDGLGVGAAGERLSGRRTVLLRTAVASVCGRRSAPLRRRRLRASRGWWSPRCRRRR